MSAHLLLEAGRLSGLLPPEVRSAIGDMVRSMNCYYSNLIEGHDTLPIDIERAMRADYLRRAKVGCNPLVDRGLLVSEGKFDPWRLAFPLGEVELLFPRQFAPVGVPDVGTHATAEEWGTDASDMPPDDGAVRSSTSRSR